jgi:type III pantothenate kinase
VECLQAGVLYGFAGQVDGLVRRILAELGPKAGPVTVLGTGGLAPLMMGESETVTEYVPDLTLLGLRLTYARNARSTSVTMGSSNSPADVSGRAAR